MSRALTTCRFEPTADQNVASERPVDEGIAAEVRFREDLWRAYRLEATNAGVSTAQAIEYANALSPEMGRVVAESEIAPVGRGWYYQSRAKVVGRTINSGLITLSRWEKRKSVGRTAAPDISRLPRVLRWWIAGGKS